MNIPFTVSCASILSFSILSTQEKPELNKATEPAGKTSVQVTDPALNEMRERVAAIQNLNTTKVHQGNAADAASSSDFYTQNFDALGRVSIKVDQIGTTCTMNYDLAGRMTEKQYHTGATPAQGGTITPGGTLESTDTFSYDAATQIDNHILWNTRRRDELTGYYMYKYRHYSAELGRWLARDPIEEKGGVNLYGFVGNDPIGRWDKLGLFDCSPCGDQCDKCFANPEDKARCIRSCLTEKLKKNCYTKKRRGGGGGGGGGQNCRENPAQTKFKPKKKLSCIDRCLKRNYGSTVEFTDTLGLHSTVAVASGLGVETLSRTADKKITNIPKHNKMTSRLLKKAGSNGHAHNVAKAASRAGAFKGALSKTGTVGTAVGFGSSVYSGAARAQCYVKCKGGWVAKLLPHIR